MKKFLIIQLRPEDATSDSEYGAILKSSGLVPSDTHRMRAEQRGLPNIDLEKYLGVIVGGSPFDISKPRSEKSPIQIKLEEGFNRLFHTVVGKDFPFIGACSGNGLLGSYCGANISSKFSEPVHGINVTLTEEGLNDPILKGVPKVFRALVGHKEACDSVPPNTTLLATGKDCPVQMFKVKNNVYATQFHPEADAKEFELRINVYKNYGYFKPEEAQSLIDNVKKQEIIYPKLILKNFVELYS